MTSRSPWKFLRFSALLGALATLGPPPQALGGEATGPPAVGELQARASTEWAALRARVDEGRDGALDEVADFIQRWTDRVAGGARQGRRVTIPELGEAVDTLVRWSEHPEGERLPRAIRALSGGGTATWDRAVAGLLLRTHDADGSGAIDAPGEVRAVPCAAWSAVDEGVRSRWDQGVWGTYGLDDGALWLGGLLGVDRAVRPALRDALVRCGLEAPGAGQKAKATGRLQRDLPSTIRALPGGGSDAWDEAVADALLATFDRDASGRIDTGDELSAIPCDVWQAVDEGVRVGWGRGVYVVYGFHPQRVWVGEVLGVGEVVRASAASRLEACGLPVDETPEAPTVDTLPARIGALPAGGSNPWDAAVRDLLVQVYDANVSGLLEGDEVAVIPCDTWAAIDTGVRRSWPSGLYVTYGFEPTLLWLGDALGIELGARKAAAEVLRRCELGHEGMAEAALPVGPEVFTTVVARLPAAGTPPWNEFVRTMLLRLFDHDRSGELDETPEVRAVTCEIWRVLDDAVRAEHHEDLYERYGFDPDDRWQGYTLGIQGGLRAIVADELWQCGLVRGGGIPAAATGGGTGADALRVPRELAPFDLDGSGLLDLPREVRAVPCSVWRDLEDEARSAFGLGLIDVYGLRPGTLWTGDAVGLAPRVRGIVRRSASRCLP